jgi:eukaryotic-like serine/threonine-protein kinase
VGGMVGTTVGLVEAQQQRDAADEARVEAQRQRDVADKAREQEAVRRAEAVNERDRANRAKADALAVLEFFQEKVLAAAGPKDQQEGGLGINATIREAVDAAEPKIGESFRDSPAVEASIRNVIGIVYGYLGENEREVLQLQEALKLLQANLEKDHPETLQSMNNLGTAYTRARRPNQAIPLLEETLKLRTAKLGTDDLATLTTKNNLAMAYMQARRLKEALPLLEKTLEIRKVELGLKHPDTIASMNNLALAYKDLALASKDAKRLNAAIALYQETLELERAGRLGPEHIVTLTTMYNLAEAYRIANRVSDALPLFEETLKLRRVKLGPEHPDTLNVMLKLAGAYRDTKQFPAEEPLLRELEAAAGKRHGADSLEHASQLAWLGDNLLRQRKYSEAEQVLHDCLAIREKTQPNEWTTFNSQAVLGGSMLGQEKYKDAEPLLLQGYQGMKERADKMGKVNLFHLTEALEQLVQLYETTGQQDQAQKWRKELDARKGKGKL